MRKQVRIRKVDSFTLKTVGYTLVTLGLLMLPSLIYQLVDGKDPLPFLVPMILMVAVGSVMLFFTRTPRVMNPIFILADMALMWGISVICGAIPFFFSGFTFVDALFESSAGVMTTGSSIISSMGDWSRGIILWRSVLQWVGGIAIIVMFLLILPTIGFGSRELLSNEMSGSDAGNISLKLKDTGKQFALVYLFATLVILVALSLCGVTFFESLCLSFSTISLGGFSPLDHSVSYYSDVVKIIIMVSLIFGSTNFYLHYKSLVSRKPVYHKSEEFRAMMFLTVIVLVISMAYLLAGGEDSFINILFNTISATTTASFAASDYTTYPFFIVFLLFFVTIIGGSAGSTAGGLKVSRFVIISKNAYNEVKKLLHPNAVFDVKMDGTSVDDRYISITMVMFFAFFLTAIVGTGVFLFFGMPFDVSVLTSISSLTSYGASIGPYGPFGSFAGLSDGAKLFMCILMWIGRVEIMSAFILFTPGYWKEFRLSIRNIRRRSVKPWR